MQADSLLKQYNDYLANIKAGGARILAFKTPCCNTSMEAEAPGRGDQWDSMMTCPNCGAHFFKVARHTKITGHMPKTK